MNLFKKFRLYIKAKGNQSVFRHLKKEGLYAESVTNLPQLTLLNCDENHPLHFLHSGNTGDILYAIPAMLALAKQNAFHLHIKINQKTSYALFFKHPMGNVLLNRKTFEMLLPLLQYQTFIINIDEYIDQQIDFDLDQIRKFPFLLDRGNIARWYFLIYPGTFDFNKPWITAPTDPTTESAILIARSMRYQAPGINYSFLKRYPNVQFTGLPDEYKAMKEMIPDLVYRPVANFLEMASLIKGSRLFIGNQSAPFALAEGLKVNRLLELYFQCPNVTVYGENGFEFCLQNQFEHLVKIRYEQ